MIRLSRASNSQSGSEARVEKVSEPKGVATDGIIAEVLKSMDILGVSIIHTLCQKIRTSGKWPGQWYHSIFVALLKKVPF